MRLALAVWWLAGDFVAPGLDSEKNQESLGVLLVPKSGTFRISLSTPSLSWKIRNDFLTHSVRVESMDFGHVELC